LQEGLAGGSEERLVSEQGDKIVKGKVTIKEFFEKNKATWSKAA
jgi:hypothetical protein